MKPDGTVVSVSDISVSGSFPGGNPQSETRIISSGKNNFLIFPESESNSPSYKFRLDVNFCNSSESQILVTFSLNWQDSTYALLRSGLYYCDENAPDDWRYLPGQIQVDGLIWYTLSLLPGITKVSGSPRYDHAELSQLIALSKDKQNIRIEEFTSDGLTEKVNAFLLQRQHFEKRPVILVIARCHPYETAGSYCLDGVIKKFVNDAIWQTHILARFDFCLIPILTVNGVRHGFCRLDGVGELGIDLGRQWNDGEDICEVIRAIVDRYTVAGYLELHNWMHPNCDGIMYADYWSCRRFVKKLNSYCVTTKRFRTRFRYGIFSGKTYGILNWVKCNSKAKCLAVEYPWYGRTVDQMRELGVATIETFALLL